MRFAVLSLLSVSVVFAGGSTALLSQTGVTATGATPKPASTVYTLADKTGFDSDTGCPTDPVSNVLGFPADGKGSVKPTARITSRNTEDYWENLALDSSGNVYVSSLRFSTSDPCGYIPGSGKVLVFSSKASGIATPIRTITGLAAPNMLAVDRAGHLYVSTDGAILEFAAEADGEAKPIRTIRVPTQNITTGAGYPEGLAVDESGNIVYASATGLPDALDPAIAATIHDKIEIFTPRQSGDATPSRTISGSKSQLLEIEGLGLDRAGNIYVSTQTHAYGQDPSILEFAGGVNGADTPINIIHGDRTGISMFESYVLVSSLAVDPAGDIYVIPFPVYNTEGVLMLRFAAGARGNVAPTEEIVSEGQAPIAVF